MGARQEKHLAVVSVDGKSVTVNIGFVEHHMSEEQCILGVCCQTDKGFQRKCFEIGKALIVIFALFKEKTVAVYAYCNIHGLW